MRRTTLAIAALMLTLTSCSSATSIMSSTTKSPGGLVSGGGVGGPGAALSLVSGALVRFDACDDFLTHVKAEAVDRVGPYGLDWHYGSPRVWQTGIRTEMLIAVPEAAPAAEAGGGSADYSITNNQEAGVDEADIVKTDGERIVAITNNRLSVIDVTGRKPSLVGSLALSPEFSVQEMFMHGDTVILLGNTWGPMPYVDIGFGADAVGMAVEEYYGGGSPIVTLTEVDISDEPAVVTALQIDGGYISSRMIDGVARVAITSGPNGFVWAYPEGNGLRAERAAIAANREIIEESTIEDWVPYFILSNASGTVLDEGPAIRCDQAHHPEEFAGFNMLSILTFDLDDGFEIADSTGVLAAGETVYASTNSMYVATNDWFDMAILEDDGVDLDREFDGARTQIHQFDLSGPSTEYVATGSIPGYLLNQFAMSEHNGDLRVASTTSPNWWGRGRTSQESVVSVLRPDNGELEVIGQVGGLGKDEQIYSVRFLGDVGYVVTFRQTDPLFTVDLSDPTDPVVRGELKIPGYSAYLHPVSDTLIVGVGQDATDTGGILGSQISLFDVSDLDKPERIAKLTLGRDSNSTAEYDHRAFLLWEDTIVLPITEYGWHNGKDDFHTGAVAIAIGDDALTEIARVTHPRGNDPHGGWNSQILRSLVIGDSLFTISNEGLLESNWVDFDDVTWLDFDVR